MNKRFALLFLLSSSSLYAEPKILAPVIDNSIYSNGAVGQSEKSSQNSMNEVFNRLEQMQQEMQGLRGVIEEQSQSLDKLNKRQNNIYSDLDQRLQQVSGTTKRKPVRSTTVAKKPVQVDHVIEPTVAVEAKAIVKKAVDIPVNPMAMTEDNTIVAPKPENVMPEITKTPSTADQETANSLLPKEQKELYQYAYEMLRNGHNIQAIEGFNKLLTLYPTGKFASNSQYWLGEAYKVTHNLEAAKIAFSKVVNSYGKSYKVPDALLKLGYIELEQGNQKEAKRLLTRISRRYPNTTVAHLAKKKLLQLETVSP